MEFQLLLHFEDKIIEPNGLVLCLYLDINLIPLCSSFLFI